MKSTMSDIMSDSGDGLLNSPEAHDADNLIDCEDGTVVFSKEGKTRLWEKEEFELVDYHSLPDYLKDNEYILGYYRAEWPIKQTLLSIFSIHDETLNVWTHLIGFFLFLFLTIYLAVKAPTVVDLQSLQEFAEMIKKADLQKIRAQLSNCVPSIPNLPDLAKLKHELTPNFPSAEFFSSLAHWNVLELLKKCLTEQISPISTVQDSNVNGSKIDLVNLVAPLLMHPITRWPFFVFLGGAMFCLLASSTCHLVACHSQRLSYIMLRIDYAGIAGLISTSFYPPVYYSFMCHPVLCYLYLICITVLGVATIVFSLLPVFEKPEFRSYRASLFFAMGFSGVAPTIHKLILFHDQHEALETTAYEVLMGALYGLGAIIYVARIPKRWMPGKFDIAGHSHQLFHILVVAGAYTHYQAGLIYLRWRDSQGC